MLVGKELNEMYFLCNITNKHLYLPISNIYPDEYLMKTDITMSWSHWCHAHLISTSSLNHHV